MLPENNKGTNEADCFNKCKLKNLLWAGNFSEPFDGRIKASAAISKNENTTISSKNASIALLEEGYTSLAVERDGIAMVGVHLQIPKKLTRKVLRLGRKNMRGY